MTSLSRTSSSSIPCRTNANMRKSELCDPTRRSFNGSPFTTPAVITNPKAFNLNTPANSPSDFSRRHSTDRESVASLRDPNKENYIDQNPKPTRLRSPAVSKGKKNFMAPTISAASKINASPRKKILVERNELARSSVSFSDVKSLIMQHNESTSEIALKPKKVSFSDVKSMIMEDNECKEPLEGNADSVQVIPSFEISPKVSILAPLDADPLMIPHDPQTNYLSPRPQFLHYRPNPRIELYQERDGKQLKECLATESYYDTGETESEGSQRESEDAAATVEESFEAKRRSKQRFCTKSKFIVLLMVLAFAYFSVLAANSPAFTSSGLEELSLLKFHVPPQITTFAKAKFEVFTENLSSSRQGDKFSLFEYANLSHLLENEDHMVDEGHHHGLMFDHSVIINDQGEVEANEAVDEDEEEMEEETDAGEDDEEEDFKSSDLVPEAETDATEQEIKAEMIELDDQLDAGCNVDLKATEIKHDISKTWGPEGDESSNIAETMFPEEDSTYSSQISVDDSTIIGPEDRFLVKNTTGFALLVLCLLAASALVYTKRGKPSVAAGLKDSSSEPNDNHQSQERRKTTYRRESTALSDNSTGSSSYGSFTTYDKIPSKHRGREEGIVTPVRRSSRIRNQVMTSP
ncbi:uncharacterized protein LOC105783186 [Gossypium raimondii]|uniref:Uncharacterized protein n=1 Tax=Gossypium raimondii TaxID=29730 RepID=A0A0D2VAX8_GOSRA|nr:uncharacterized protein LOC105783186 [Gossypium raimondii]KJB79479.1 hypothetical protein B456_013G052200 [Gossypium raimondii]MBA0602186.1 hypothetical protein [Gossypium raimondii]